MYNTQYIEANNVLIPYIQKDGLRIVARPIGKELSDKIHRLQNNGDVGKGGAVISINENKLISNPTSDKTSPSNKEAVQSIEVGFYPKPPGMPGYHVSFPTELDFKECVVALDRCIDHEMNVQSLFFLDEDGNNNFIRAYHSDSADEEQFSAFTDGKAAKEYIKNFSQFRICDLLKDEHIGKVLDASPNLSMSANNAETVKMIGAFPYFWYEKPSVDESGYKQDKVFVVNVTHYDPKMMEEVAKASLFELKEEELNWLKSLFPE